MQLLFPDDEVARRRRDRVLAALFLLLLVFLVARAARKDGGVLVRNQEFGARFLAGEDPYVDPARGHRVHGPYPPSFALVAAPLSMLPTPVARVAWGIAQAGALLGLYFLLRRWAVRWWPSVAPHAPVLFAAALLLTSRYVLRDMAGGGGNLLFLALALFGFDLAFAGRGGLAGVPLALSLVLKPNLAPLLLFLAVRRRWNALGSTVLVGATLFLLPAAAYGLDRYLDLSERWARDVVAYAAVDDPTRADLVPDGMPVSDTSMNQSLREAILRAGLPAWFGRALGLVLALAAAAVALRARPGRSEVLAALAFLPLALLLSPISWKAHHAALLPLFFGLACEARASRGRALTAFLAVTWVACGLLSEEIVGETAKERLQALSIVTIFDVLLLAVALSRSHAAA